MQQNKRNIFDSAFNSGVEVSSSTFRQVYVPFKKRIPAGDSQFTVDVPQIYTDRDFYFSSLVLLPDFYSLEALSENLEEDQVSETPIDYEISFKVSYKRTPPFFPDIFTPSRDVSTTIQLAKAANKFFELHKPGAATRTGCFFDWTDLRFNGDVESWDNWVQHKMALVYYNEPYDEAKHFNALPVSARTVAGANNYLMPTSMTEETLANFRFRLVLAPNTDAYFSTNGPLLNMGFRDSQIGQRTAKNKFKIRNPENSTFHFLTARSEPTETLDKSTIFKFNLDLYSNDYISDSAVISITKKDSLKNEKYLKILKDAMEVFSYESNVKIDATYNETEKTFSFALPVDRAINFATLLVPKELAERLGFDFVNDITYENKKGKPVSEDIDVKNTEEKARALGYDTGVIIVSNANIRSNTTAGINEEFMCSLYPTATGTFEITHLESCFKPATTKLPHFYTSSTGTVPAVFKLSRYLDNSQLVELDWKNGAFVSGLLRGSKPKTYK
jgi:hypothetical protein